MARECSAEELMAQLKDEINQAWQRLGTQLESSSDAR
jgi:hypothetical protein